MGTIIINGKRFAGNSITISDGKVVIDGKAQDGELAGDVEVQVAEGGDGRAECIASVTCGEGRGAGDGIRVMAFASAGSGARQRQKR